MNKIKSNMGLEAMLNKKEETQWRLKTRMPQNAISGIKFGGTH